MEWISVEDKQPEENGRYLCFVKNLFYRTDTYMRLLWLDNKFPWVKNREPEYEVTHWMPLPDPPKSKDKEEA